MTKNVFSWNLMTFDCSHSKLILLIDWNWYVCIDISLHNIKFCNLYYNKKDRYENNLNMKCNQIRNIENIFLSKCLMTNRKEVWTLQFTFFAKMLFNALGKFWTIFHLYIKVSVINIEHCHFKWDGRNFYIKLRA